MSFGRLAKAETPIHHNEGARHDGAGRPIGFVLISKDISDEIRLTEQLRATQFYTRSLIESTIDALMITDPVGIISDVNQQVALTLVR